MKNLNTIRLLKICWIKLKMKIEIRLSLLQKQKIQLNKLNDANNSKLKFLYTLNESLQDQLKLFSAKLKKEQIECKNLSKILESKVTENLKLTSENSRLTDELENFTNKLIYFKQRIDELEEEKSKFKQIKESLENDLHTCQYKNLMMKEMLQKKESELKLSQDTFDIKYVDMMNRMIKIKQQIEGDS